VDDAGRFTRVGAPGAAPGTGFAQLLGINDHGVAVGVANDSGGTARGYTYDLRDGSFTLVGLPVAADAVTATGINDDGDISGFLVNAGITKGFQLEHTGFFRELSFGSGTDTQALGIDRADELVGSYLDTDRRMHGFLWAKGRLRTIDDPLGAGGTVVNGLDNSGRLVGFYVDGTGATHGFLATARR
jgi:uncharacterized membrane protein